MAGSIHTNRTCSRSPRPTNWIFKAESEAPTVQLWPQTARSVQICGRTEPSPPHSHCSGIEPLRAVEAAEPRFHRLCLASGASGVTKEVPMSYLDVSPLV